MRRSTSSSRSCAAQSQDHTVAQFEIYLFASRHPALRVHVEKILDETRALAAAVLQTNGVTDPHAAAAVVALIDGFALHRIARSEEVQFQSLAHALRAAIVGFVTLAATSSLGEGITPPLSWHKRTGFLRRSSPRGVEFTSSSHKTVRVCNKVTR